MVSSKCPTCGSTKIVKRGKRYNRSGEKQRYLCNKCHATFIEPDGFERMRHKREDITRAVHQHIDGFSLFQTQYHLWQHDKVKVTRRTISRWTEKYSLFLKEVTSRSRTKTQGKATFR